MKEAGLLYPQVGYGPWGIGLELYINRQGKENWMGRTGESSPIIIVLIKSNWLSCAHEQETH